jgi:hypothetical protein
LRNFPGMLACAALLTLPAMATRAAEASVSSADTVPPAFAEVLALLATRRHSHVSFTEVAEFKMLDRPLQSSGELLYDAPDRLEKRTLTPRAEDLLLANGELTAARGHHTRTVALRDYPQLAPLVESLRATLAGDRAALERLFKVAFSGSVEHWTLLLVPVDATLARSVQEVRIEGARNVLASVEILQTDGDRSRLTIGPEISP